MRRSPAFFALLLLFPVFFFSTVFPLQAQTSSSGAYTIERGTVSWDVLEGQTQPYTLAQRMGEANAGLFVRNGFVAQSGHRNRAENSIFTVSLTAPSLDYGSINTNQSITKSINILVSFPDMPGYTLSVAQDHPLRSPSGKIIPDSICDDSKRTCNTRQAALWIDPSVPGLGYRITSPSGSADFLSLDHYRPFTSLGLVDRRAATVVQSLARHSPVEQTILTVKVQSLQSDPSDQYTNTIIITAVPML